MQSTLSPDEIFYRKLGSLFYAVASADRSVEVKEINKLSELLRNKWKDSDGGLVKSRADSERWIEQSFKSLLSHNTKSEDAFNDFKSYKQENQLFFNTEMNHRIFKTARAIAAAFSRLNKSELVLLEKLKMLLS